METVVVLLEIVVSLFCALGIVLTTKWHGKFSLDGKSGVQKIHLVLTLRPGMPDSRHLHSLFKVGIVMRWFPTLRADLRKASVSSFPWASTAVPAALAVLFPEDTGALMLSSFASFALYLAFYWLVAEAGKNQPARRAEVFPLVQVKSDEPLPMRRVS